MSAPEMSDAELATWDRFEAADDERAECKLMHPASPCRQEGHTLSDSWGALDLTFRADQ